MLKSVLSKPQIRKNLTPKPYVSLKAVKACKVCGEPMLWGYCIPCLQKRLRDKTSREDWFLIP